MPRRKLTATEKKKMQAARVRSKKEKAEALAALQNPQFTNAKFWKAVDPTLVEEIVRAIAKAQEAAKQRKIAKLEAELAELKGGTA